VAALRGEFDSTASLTRSMTDSLLEYEVAL